MPLRSKIKKAFGSSKDDNEAKSPTSPTGTDQSLNEAVAKKDKSAKKSRWLKRDTQWDDWPEHLYKPHEVPLPKYRRAPAKEHTQKLESYSWGGADDAHAEDRRPSATSQYSPMGSRLHSRRSSLAPDAAATASPLSTVEGIDPQAEEDDEDALTRVDTAKPSISASAMHVEHADRKSADAFSGAELAKVLTAIQNPKPATATVVV